MFPVLTQSFVSAFRYKNYTQYHNVQLRKARRTTLYEQVYSILLSAFCHLFLHPEKRLLSEFCKVSFTFIHRSDATGNISVTMFVWSWVITCLSVVSVGSSRKGWYWILNLISKPFSLFAISIARSSFRLPMKQNGQIESWTKHDQFIVFRYMIDSFRY